MAIYKGEVIESPNEDFPFIAVVTDEAGTVVSEVPVRTRADGEAMIVEALQALGDKAREGGHLA
jgi:hypothetical protein